MVPQAWISLLVFVLIVIYSVIMTIRSEEFRRIVKLNNKWMFVYFFTAIVVIGILALFSIECSVSGSYSSKACLYYSWVMTALLVLIALIFVLRTIKAFWTTKTNENSIKK